MSKELEELFNFTLAIADLAGGGGDDDPGDDQDVDDDTQDDLDQDDDLGDEGGDDQGDDDLGDDNDDGSQDDKGADGQQKGKQKPEAKTFTQEQLDQIVEGRIARTERQFQKRMMEAAGTRLEQNEIPEMARLWGFMKMNPDLSNAIQGVIDKYIETGKAQMPHSTAQNNELNLREAIIDMKEQDKTFRKHSKEILEWAEDNGFDVVDGKSLKLAYLAWKGENAPQQLAKAQLEGQRKAQQKAKAKQAAALEGGRAPRKGGRVDYSKMSATDILRHEGLSLFTE